MNRMSPHPDDDERTRAAPIATDPTGHAEGLPAGTRLGEFEVRSRLGDGGFSIVYLAWDHSLEREVALKEYLPATLAVRGSDTRIVPRSERHRDTFEIGLRSFVNEAKLLARFDHPALVKVHRFWQANGTAYMVMPFYEGRTLKSVVQTLPRRPDEAWLRGLLAPLFEAIEVLHSAQCYHRDIAPDNILLLASTGKPLLLDFGAARRVIGDRAETPTVILKPGYAPIEQYAEVPGLVQGAWTDVYALAALVEWCTTGSAPPSAVGRMLNDAREPLAKRLAGRYTPGFLTAIDRALEVMPERRTRSIDALRHDLATTTAPTTATTPVQIDDATTVILPLPRPVPAPSLGRPQSTRRAAWGAGAGAVLVLLGGLAWWSQSSTGPSPAPEAAIPTALDPQPPRSVPAEPMVPAPEATASPVDVEAPGAASAPVAVAAIPPAPPSSPSPTSTTATPRTRAPRAERTAEPQAARRGQAPSAECGALLTRLSLGESSPELTARMRELNCR